MIKEILPEELFDMEKPLVVDVRSAQAFSMGTVPGAVNIPLELEDEYDDMDPDQILKSPAWTAAQEAGIIAEKKPVFFLCHTGVISKNAAQALENAGYQAVSVKGGYRAWLNVKLRRELAGMEEASADEKSAHEAAPGGRDMLAGEGTGGRPGGGEETGSRTSPRLLQIERSIIKKYRKQLWCRFTKAVRDYQLIQEGDRIAVCISGGKDSMLMAKLMQEIQRHGKVRFEIVYLCMNPGYNEENWSLIRNNAKLLGIPLTTFESDIFESVEHIEHHPCYLCARMRRGYLYNNAKMLGCNKIALGHHYDDVIETILMGILYAGKTETMMPKLHSQNFAGMELIRPLYLIREADVKAWAVYNDLHFIQCACRFTESCSIEGGNTASKRAFVKRLIRELSRDEAYVEQNIFNCVRDINLRTVIGYHKDGEYYNFLDDYEKYRK